MPIERGSAYGVRHFRVENSEALSDFFHRNFPEPKESFESLINFGSIYLNNRRITSADFILKTGDELRVHTEPRRFPKLSLKPRIRYETADLIILDKPSGIPLHALTDNSAENVISFLEVELEVPVYITHRLDIETSGLVILAKNKAAQAYINRLLAEKKIRKLYRAWTTSKVAAGEHLHFMEPSPKAPKIISAQAHEGWMLCQLEVLACVEVNGEEVKEFEVGKGLKFFRTDINLLSGRSQQIRAQLAYLGAPILGDKSYGGIGLPKAPRRIALQSYSIEFEGHHFAIVT